MSEGPTPEMVAKALRSGKNPVDPKKKPVQLQARGYQLYTKEAELNGETPLPYDKWLKQSASE